MLGPDSMNDHSLWPPAKSQLPALWSSGLRGNANSTNLFVTPGCFHEVIPGREIFVANSGIVHS